MKKAYCIFILFFWATSANAMHFRISLAYDISFDDPSKNRAPSHREQNSRFYWFTVNGDLYADKISAYTPIVRFKNSKRLTFSFVNGGNIYGANPIHSFISYIPINILAPLNSTFLPTESYWSRYLTSRTRLDFSSNEEPLLDTELPPHMGEKIIHMIENGGLKEAIEPDKSDFHNINKIITNIASVGTLESKTRLTTRTIKLSKDYEHLCLKPGIKIQFLWYKKGDPIGKSKAIDTMLYIGSGFLMGIDIDNKKKRTFFSNTKTKH